MERTIFESEHHLFRESFRQFVDKEIVPNNQTWEEKGVIDRSLFEIAGSNGFLGIDIPQEFGGGGIADYRFNQIMQEEFDMAGVAAAASCLLYTSPSPRD